MTASQAGPKPQLPPTTTRWVRLLLGFSVSVTVGLAPYLGKLRVPLFTPMLSIIPESMQDLAIPISAAAMGIVAVLVQWYGSRSNRAAWLRRTFGRVLLVCVSSLIALILMEYTMIVHVDVPAAESKASFAVGLSNPQKPPCENLSRAQCIEQKLTLRESTIEAYFGESEANLTKFLLLLVYLSFMASFGGLVGLLVLARGTS